ncbi:MAG: domain S-box protein [Bacteroidetes bacterium]|nr:domain S-box protein [Bacteroidota bacterium]
MPHSKLKVLLIDDSEDDLFLTSHYLSKIDTFNITIDKEVNYNKARKRILENNHDIYIIDYLLGPETGLELIRDCAREGINKPFILLTGKGGREIDLEAAKTGVYDYLTKSNLNAELLERSIRYSLQRYSSYVAMAESEFRYRQIFNKSTDVIFVLDHDFKLVNFNPMMTVLLGYTDEELINQPINMLFEHAQEADEFLYHTEYSDTKSDIEIVLRTKHGIRKNFLASSSQVTSIDGDMQYQGILYDYTNLKKSLEERSLDERIEAIGKMVRSMAHEIRNPLTNINLSLHQLQEITPEEGKIYTDIITRNSKRINDLIGELMNLSNPIDQNHKPININTIIQSALADAMDRIQLKEISVSEDLTESEAIIMGDRSKLHMALLNIIINAVEAMESTKGLLTIKTSSQDNNAHIEITDNGEGIPTDNIPHLFQPYFTGKKNGMGLGLATTHSVVKAHKGKIEVESVFGKGTTFIIKLPAIQLS